MGCGLVVEVPVQGPEAERFARAHRLIPLAWGHGTDVETGMYQVGHPTSVMRAYPGVFGYLVWTMSPAHPDLWTIALRVWEDFGIDELYAEEGVDLDLRQALGGVLLVLPLLAEMALVCVDRVGVE